MKNIDSEKDNIIKNEVFIGRQPILNRLKKTFGYELLFRRGAFQSANVTDNVKATATVMVNALNNIGISRLIGDKKGFINVDEQVLSSGIVDLLPGKQTVLEVLETVEINDAVVDLCKIAKKEGFGIALDDFIYDGASPMLGIADYIKIDVMATEKETIKNICTLLKKYPAKLVAEKFETSEDFDFCSNLGFDYFQGYFFAKPSIISAKSISPTQVVLLDLSRLLAKEEDFFIIEKIFRQNPELQIKLLQFINPKTAVTHKLTLNKNLLSQ